MLGERIRQFGYRTGSHEDKMWVHPFAWVRTPIHFPRRKGNRFLERVWVAAFYLHRIFQIPGSTQAGGHTQQSWVTSSVVIFIRFEVNRTTVRYLFDKLINQFIPNLFFFNRNNLLKKNILGTSLVVQWLRLHLPMLGVLAPSLVGALKSHMLCS